MASNPYSGPTVRVAKSVGELAVDLVKLPFRVVAFPFRLLASPSHTLRGLRHSFSKHVPNIGGETIFGPDISVHTPRVDASGAAITETKRSGFLWLKKAEVPIYDTHVIPGKAIGITGVTGRLQHMQERVKEFPQMSHIRDLEAREFNRSIADIGYQKKQLGGSITHFVHKFEEKVLGKDISQIGSKKMPANIMETVERAQFSSKAGIFERAAGAPMRLATKAPILAAVVAAGGTLYGLSSFFSSRDARRTSENNMADMMQAQQQMTAMNNPYMNSVSPQEAMLLDARMRGAGGSRGDFAANVQASRQAVAPGQQ